MSNMYQKIIRAEEALLKLRSHESGADLIKNEIFELETKLAQKKEELASHKKDLASLKSDFEDFAKDTPDGITKSKFIKLINSRVDNLFELGLLPTLEVNSPDNKNLEASSTDIQNKSISSTNDDSILDIVNELDETVSYEDEISAFVDDIENPNDDEIINIDEVDDIPDFLS